jgi:hypothetical protein
MNLKKDPITQKNPKSAYILFQFNHYQEVLSLNPNNKQFKRLFKYLKEKMCLCWKTVANLPEIQPTAECLEQKLLKKTDVLTEVQQPSKNCALSGRVHEKKSYFKKRANC